MSKDKKHSLMLLVLVAMAVVLPLGLASTAGYLFGGWGFLIGFGVGAIISLVASFVYDAKRKKKK